MSDFAIGLAVFTWLYFGVCGVWKMWKFIGVPSELAMWVVMLLVSLLGVLFGPIWMQAVYETIIEYLEESEASHD